MFYGTEGTLWNIPHIQSEWRNILQNIVNPHSIVMDLNNVMKVRPIKRFFKPQVPWTGTLVESLIRNKVQPSDF